MLDDLFGLVKVDFLLSILIRRPLNCPLNLFPEVELVRRDGDRPQGGLHRGRAALGDDLQDPTFADGVQNDGGLQKRPATFLV